VRKKEARVSRGGGQVITNSAIPPCTATLRVWGRWAGKLSHRAPHAAIRSNVNRQAMDGRANGGCAGQLCACFAGVCPDPSLLSCRPDCRQACESGRYVTPSIRFVAAGTAQSACSPPCACLEQGHMQLAAGVQTLPGCGSARSCCQACLVKHIQIDMPSVYLAGLWLSPRRLRLSSGGRAPDIRSAAGHPARQNRPPDDLATTSQNQGALRWTVASAAGLPAQTGGSLAAIYARDMSARR